MEMQIKTKRGIVETVLCDDADYDLVKEYEWHIQYDKGKPYVRCNIVVNGKYKSPKMHRIIMGVSHKSRPHVDHINHNGCDNRRSNLRLATIRQNTCNVGLTKRNTSGYKGVYLYKSGANAGLYTACIVSGGEKHFGGYFRSAVEAAARYNEMALEYHMDFAFFNKFDEKVLSEAKRFIPPDKPIKPPSGKLGFYGVMEASEGSNRKKPFRVIFRGKLVGYFGSDVDAAKAYDEVAKKNGETRKLNFPNETN